MVDGHPARAGRRKEPFTVRLSADDAAKLTALVNARRVAVAKDAKEPTPSSIVEALVRAERGDPRVLPDAAAPDQDEIGRDGRNVSLSLSVAAQAYLRQRDPFSRARAIRLLVRAAFAGMRRNSGAQLT